MSIEIVNNSGEPYEIVRPRKTNNFGDDKTETVEVQHGESYVLSSHDPENPRFIIRPARNPHLPRDFRATVRSDENMRED